MSLRLITAPFRLLYKIISLLLGTLVMAIMLVLVEVFGVYYYLQNMRPEALDRLRDSNSLLTDLAEILLSPDVILVMILLAPATYVMMYIAGGTSSRHAGEDHGGGGGGGEGGE